MLPLSRQLEILSGIYGSLWTRDTGGCGAPRVSGAMSARSKAQLDQQAQRDRQARKDQLARQARRESKVILGQLDLSD